MGLLLRRPDFRPAGLGVTPSGVPRPAGCVSPGPPPAVEAGRKQPQQKEPKMTTHRHTTAKPTRKQLAFLRALAHRTGTTFVYPKTRGQASRQIAALLDRPLSSQLDLELDRASVHDGDLLEEAA